MAGLMAAACSDEPDPPDAGAIEADQAAQAVEDNRSNADMPASSVPMPAEGTFTAVAAGFWHTCAIRADGGIDCWGVNQSGLLDAPDGQFKAISAGPGHNCAIRTDGSIECWGEDLLGILDPPEGEFIALSAGARFTCALRDDGDVECWGGADRELLTPPGGHFTAGGGRTRSRLRSSQRRDRALLGRR